MDLRGTSHLGTDETVVSGRLVQPRIPPPAAVTHKDYPWYSNLKNTVPLKRPSVAEDYPDYNPWLANEASANIEQSRRAFRFVAWEYRNPPRPSLSRTNWEDPLLVSVLIIRDPIARLLAGDGFVLSRFPGVRQYAKDPDSFTGNPSHHEWFRFCRIVLHQWPKRRLVMHEFVTRCKRLIAPCWDGIPCLVSLDLSLLECCCFCSSCC